MHTIYFSDMTSQGMGICVRSLLWGEQWAKSWPELIGDLKCEGVPYSLVDVDMLEVMPEDIANV